MSAPTSQLGKLSLRGGMSTARAAGQPLTEDPGASTGGGPSDNEGEQGSAALYAGNITVDKCRSSSDGMHFLISEHIQVHLEEGRFTCTCANLEKEAQSGPCRHLTVSL